MSEIENKINNLAGKKIKTKPLDEIDESNFNWVKESNTPYYFDFNPVKLPLGPQVEVKSILEAFYTFVDLEVLNLICEKSNINAQKDNFDLKLDINDLKKYLAIIILMAIIKKPCLSSYWSNDEIEITPIFKRIMSKIRFDNISKYLSFENEENKEDTLWPIRKLMNIFRKNFIKNFSMNRELSLDESLVKFKGRFKYRTFNPMKRARYGFKFYKLNDSKTGYCYNFNIYLGDEEHDLDDESSSKTEQIVFKLLDLKDISDFSLLDRGYHVYLDSFYTSPKLILRLIKRKTHCVGTMNVIRKYLPEIIKKYVVKDGHSIYRTCKKNNILLIKFNDRKSVVLASTIHKDNISDLNAIYRPKKKKNLTSIPKNQIQDSTEKFGKPICVYDYNKYMGGVDKQDQRMASHSIVRRHVKFYRKLFEYFIDTCIFNATILYKTNNTFAQIKLQLVRELLQELKITSNNEKNDLYTENFSHVLIRNIGEDGKTKSLECVYCKKIFIRSCSIYKCRACNKAMHVECYEDWHLERNV